MHLSVSLSLSLSLCLNHPPSMAGPAERSYDLPSNTRLTCRRNARNVWLYRAVATMQICKPVDQADLPDECKQRASTSTD